MRCGQRSKWKHLLRSPLLLTEVICCSGAGTRRGKTAGPVTKPLWPKQGLQWHVLAQHSVSRPHCLCTFPDCLSSSQHQEAISQTSFSRMSNWRTRTRCPLTSFLLPLSTSFRVEQFMITWLTLTPHHSTIHNINSHNRVYFKYFFNPLRKPISSLNVPLIYSK